MEINGFSSLRFQQCSVTKTTTITLLLKCFVMKQSRAKEIPSSKKLISQHAILKLLSRILLAVQLDRS